MQIFQIAGLGVVGTILVVIVRQAKPEIAIQMSAAIGALIFLILMERIMLVFETFANLSREAGIDQYYMQIIMRVIGIAYIAEFGAQLCRDAGEGVIAKKIELAGKVLIMSLALPVLLAVVDTVAGLLP